MAAPPIEASSWESEQSFVSDDSWSNRCWDCNVWSKYTLFVINFLVWTAGTVMLILGTWVRLQKKGQGFFDHVMVDPAYMLIALGSLMFVISLFGCAGALREHMCLLKTFILLVVCVFILQVLAGVLAVVLMDTVRTSMQNYMQLAITQYGTDEDTREAIDYLQKLFYCCGAAGSDDWESNSVYNCSSTAVARCGVPRSCCRIPTSPQCGYGARTYTKYADQVIFTQGCIGPLMALFKDHLVIIGLIALFLGLLELLSMLLAHKMARNIITNQKTYL